MRRDGECLRNTPKFCAIMQTWRLAVYMCGCVCVFFWGGEGGGGGGTVKMHWLDAYAAVAFRA